VEIERWGGAFQAIRLTAGEHRVRFEFRPVSVQVGAAIGILAVAALLVLVAASRPRPNLHYRMTRPPAAGVIPRFNCAPASMSMVSGGA